MSEANRIRFHNVLGNFPLDTKFDVPAKGVTALFGPSGCGHSLHRRVDPGQGRLFRG
jgi:molybdate transport system ATP-binding protein